MDEKDKMDAMLDRILAYGLSKNPGPAPVLPDKDKLNQVASRIKQKRAAAKKKDAS